MDTILRYAFILALVLIAVAYFAGLTSDVNVVGSNANTLIKTLTGRNAQGQFAGYPGGYTK